MAPSEKMRLAVEARDRIFVVDDRRESLELTTRLLEGDGFLVEGTTEAMGATNRARAFKADLVILDLDLNDRGTNIGLRGENLASVMRNQLQGVPVALYSAKDAAEIRRIAAMTGAVGWLSKNESHRLCDAARLWIRRPI